MKAILYSLALCTALGFASTVPSPSLKRDSIAAEILRAIEQATTCAACQGLLVALRGIADLGDTVFVDVVTGVCQLSKAEDPDVCAGVVAAEGPILAYDLREMTIPSTTSQLFCTSLFGLCDYPAVDSYSISFPSPKPAGLTRPLPSGQTPINIVHISDIHVDLSYDVGSNANCTKPICCRPYTSADAPGNNDDPAGPYGNVKCDAPLSLEESMYAAINQLVPDPAFTIFTGDVVEHDVWLVDKTEAIGDLNDAFNARMKSNLNLVYPVVGNHEAAPVNSFPPADIATTLSSQWVYDTLSSDWATWIGSDGAASADKYGSYSVLHPGSNLRIISLNTNLYYKDNFWLYQSPLDKDPDGQLAWLVSQLDAAESSGERVWIIGHMPMGSGDALHDGSNYFDQIVTRYSNSIAALFFGHTHVDEFQIAYSDYNAQTFANALAMSYITPSMTPTSGHPAFRVYSVDPVTFGVLDFTEYIANISSPSYQSGPVWEKYYSAKAVYGPLTTPPVTDPTAELTPAFWHNVTAVFEANDAAFQEYYARKSRGYSPSTCSGSCKTNEICQLRAAEAQYNCVAVKPGIGFSKVKRGPLHAVTEETAGTEECGASLMAKVFKGLVHGQVPRGS